MTKKLRICVAVTLALAFTNALAQGGPGFKHPHGLTPQAAAELQEAGVDKYVGQFTPAVSAPVGDGFTAAMRFETGRLTRLPLANGH